MALNVPTVGETVLLQYILNKATPTNLVLHLYENDATINDSLVIGDLTELVSGGYASVNLDPADWTITSPGNVATGTHEEVVFTLTDEVDVYGYYITSTTSSVLLWAERFPGAPFQTASGGGTIAVIPKITLD